MSFRDFGFPQVQEQLGLTLVEADLFGTVPPLPLRPEFAEAVRDGVELATSIDTEKARSEFIIAPILMELRRLYRGRFSLFSGVALDVDAARGLNGVCDFLLARSNQQLTPRGPLLAVVEAKNDSPRTGLGQCIAGVPSAAPRGLQEMMVAAQEFNQRAGEPRPAVYGAATSGGAWRFTRLAGDAVTVDVRDYFVTDLGKIMGILADIVQNA